MARKTRSALVNVNPMRRLAKTLAQVNANSSHTRIKEMYKNWAAIYRGFIHGRFVNYSGGGGDWAPLRPRTVKRKGHALILQETRTLINAVDPSMHNAPGSYSRLEGKQFVVGYGGNVIHPTTRSGGRSFTIEEIAAFHQNGGGNLPKRRIIVGPDKATVGLVTEEINSAIRDILAEAAIR
jgi:hypothetical protein